MALPLSAKCCWRSAVKEKLNLNFPGRNLRMVTPQQLNQGYFLFRRDEVVIGNEQFRIVCRLPDGNFIVRDPEYPK